MKHIYEFENFLNEGATPVNLQNVKSGIKVHGMARKIIYTDLYPTGNSWKDAITSSDTTTQYKITFSVLGPNKIQCVWPSVQLGKDERFHLCLKIPGIKDIYLYQFGKPTDSMAKVNKEVPGLNEKPYYVPSKYIGKKTTWGLKTDLIVGNKLTIVIDATKAKYKNV
jgi:hypothetical protein